MFMLIFLVGLFGVPENRGLVTAIRAVEPRDVHAMRRSGSADARNMPLIRPVQAEVTLHVVMMTALALMAMTNGAVMVNFIAAAHSPGQMSGEGYSVAQTKAQTKAQTQNLELNVSGSRFTLQNLEKK